MAGVSVTQRSSPTPIHHTLDVDVTPSGRIALISTLQDLSVN